MSHFDFEVIEYERGYEPSYHVSREQSFSVSERRLLVYTMRAILTRQAPRPVRKYLAASMIPAMQFFVGVHQAPAFSVRLPSVAALRDFSVTGRVGEFAQGITYALLALGCSSYVCDFVEWSEANYKGVSLHKKKKPDFAVYQPSRGDVSVVEAKGTLTSKYRRRQMKGALEQAKGAHYHPGVRDFWGAVVDFDTDGSQTASIHLQDPEGEGQATPEAMYDLFRRSYATWFELSGEVEKEWACRPQGFTDDLLGVRSLDGEFPPGIGGLRDVLLPALGLERGATFTVHPEVERAIFDFNAFKEGGWRRVVEHFHHDRASDDRLDFPDGTVIVAT